MDVVIKGIRAIDRRFQLKEGAGSDAVHTNPAYAYAVCSLETDASLGGRSKEEPALLAEMPWFRKRGAAKGTRGRKTASLR